MRQAKSIRNYYGYLFIVPFILAFLVFGLYPIYNTIALSFTDTTLMTTKVNFIWFSNYEKLFGEKAFLTAIGNTWLIWILNFIPQIGVAMLLSVWFTNARLKIRGVGIWRALFYLPNLLMPAAVASLFFALFSYFGPVNQLMVRSGLLPKAIEYFQDETITRGLVVFIQWWAWFGQTIIVLMAGMTAIPIALYEAAMVDGGSAAQMFRHITLPLLKPVMIFIFVSSLVGGMQMFDIPFLLTDQRGSPNSSILTNNILMYIKFSSTKGHIGMASAVGVLIFLMTCVCALGIFYFLRERETN